MFVQGAILETSKAAFAELCSNPFLDSNRPCRASGATREELRLAMTKVPSWTVVVASIYGLLLAIQIAF